MKPYNKITLIYIFFGAMWIFVSDRVLEFFALSTGVLTVLQTYKGWLFIIITSLLLYSLMRKAHYQIEKREQEKRDVFITTMRAVHHILNNFLNKMLYFRMIAEESAEFGKDTLEQYDKVIKETNAQIHTLDEIANVTPEEIEKTVYSKKLNF